MSAHQPPTTCTSEEEQVASYLCQHPTWLLQRDDVLQALHLTHPSGNAVSLLERQIALLRKKNRALQTQLTDLLETARNNEQLLAQCQQLIISLLDTQDLDSLVYHCVQGLQQQFSLEFVSLLIFADPQQYRHSTTRIVRVEEAYQQIAELLQSDTIRCGVLRPAHRSFLFGEQAEQLVCAAAVAPLRIVPPLGVLAVGSRNVQDFDEHMSTVFLQYLVQVLNRMLPRYVGHHNQPTSTRNTQPI